MILETAFSKIDVRFEECISENLFGQPVFITLNQLDAIVVSFCFIECTIISFMKASKEQRFIKNGTAIFASESQKEVNVG